MKKLILILSGLVLVGVFGFLFLRSRNVGENVNPQKGSIVDAVYGLGKVKSHRRYDVRIGVLTNVKKIYVREGDIVKSGAPLVQFQETSIFRAPFDGTVTAVYVNDEEIVNQQSKILTLQDLQNLYIEVSLEQEGALRVKKGQKAEVVLENIRGDKMLGEVSAIFPKDDEFLAHIDVTGFKSQVLPGMSVDVAIIAGETQDALLVPLSSVKNGHVIRYRNGKKEKIKVEIGGLNGQWAQVLSGDLTVTDTVSIPKAK